MNSCYMLKAGVRAQVIDGEGIVISFETGNYYGGMRGAAADIIAALGAGAVMVLDAAEKLADRYGVQDRAGALVLVEEFFGRLAGEQIVTMCTPGPLVVFEGERRPEGFVFGIEKGEELADIIKLDPVHEVTAGGWPEKALA